MKITLRSLRQQIFEAIKKKQKKEFIVSYQLFPNGKVWSLKVVAPSEILAAEYIKKKIVGAQILKVNDQEAMPDFKYSLQN